MADKLYVERVIPRTVFTRQANCNNVPAELPQEYYKRVLIIPLFDNIVSEMKLWFEKVTCRENKLLWLVPSVLCDTELNIFGELVEIYEDDLSRSNLVDQELTLYCLLSTKRSHVLK